MTGKPAQFGRGVMQDVSDKLLGQFIACIEGKVGADEPSPVAPSAAEPPPAAVETAAQGSEQPAPVPAPAATPVVPPPAVTAPATAGTAAYPTAPRGPDEDDALDLGSTVLPILLRSLRQARWAWPSSRWSSGSCWGGGAAADPGPRAPPPNG